MSNQTYPIGTPGQPWDVAEKTEWRARQPRLRSHAGEAQNAESKDYDGAGNGVLPEEPPR